VSWNSILFFGSAIVSNLIYLTLGLKVSKAKKAGRMDSYFDKHQLILAGFFVMMLLWKGCLLFTQEERLLFIFDRDIIFAMSTLFVWAIGFQASKNEEGFREILLPVTPDNLEALKSSVHRAMKEKKSFKDPHLTLTEFAEIVNIKPHLLSKVINECYRQNFRDFVNKYRVEEFIELARQDNNRRFTFLALANEVGFNSKSTFNAAFKKVTQRSPRDFLKMNKILTD